MKMRMKMLKLLSGREVPVLGQGTWKMGADPSERQAEIAALRLGLDLGMTLIDTAEVYASGGSEEVVGEAIAGRREEVILVSKVSPNNAVRQSVIRSCENSLKRLKTDYLDIYLLHWPASVPFSETLEAFRQLKAEGKILDFGVSNFNVSQMEEAYALPGGDEVATNQVLYSLMNRGIERDLLPWCRKRGIPVMAYSPFEQGRLLRHSGLKEIASRLDATPAQVALAWLIHQDGVLVIPKSSDEAHIRENIKSLDLTLTDRDLAELDRVFPPGSLAAGRRRV